MQKLVAPFPPSATVNDTIFYNIVGNFIPPEWRELTSHNGKVFSKTSIQILSLLVSRLHCENDKAAELEKNGISTPNELQETYYYFEKLLGLCQRRIRQCMVELEQSGYIKLTLINMTKQYIKYRNIICISLTKNFVQLNSESFRQDEFKAEPAQRTLVREHRRMPKNSLGSSFLNDAAPYPQKISAKNEKVFSCTRNNFHPLHISPLRKLAFK